MHRRRLLLLAPAGVLGAGLAVAAALIGFRGGTEAAAVPIGGPWQDYVSAFDAPITGLSGTPAEVDAAAKAYRVYCAKHTKSGGEYDMDHSSIIYLMDPRGRFAGYCNHETAPDAIAAKLRTLMG